MARKEKKKRFCLLSLVLYHIHLFERANQERQQEAWHSWFQSTGVIFIQSVYFISSLYNDGRVGLLPGIWVLVRNQLSTSSHTLHNCCHGWPRASAPPAQLSFVSQHFLWGPGIRKRHHLHMSARMSACVSSHAWRSHPHPPQAIYLPLTTHSCQLETFVKL